MVSGGIGTQEDVGMSSRRGTPVKSSANSIGDARENSSRKGSGGMALAAGGAGDYRRNPIPNAAAQSI